MNQLAGTSMNLTGTGMKFDTKSGTQDSPSVRYEGKSMQHCEYHHCGRSADGFAMVPDWKTPGVLEKKFFCQPCWDYFVKAWNDPATWKGIWPPENAPDDWHPSLMDHLRHAEIAIAFEERDKDSSPYRYGDEKLTPAQLRCTIAYRKGLRDSE